ncbi:MAG: hypothetical protein OXB88_02130 [Bacteriovoracales bacterium]|nr:hypothetical protein [Bacteriovoracales bacterium]
MKVSLVGKGKTGGQILEMLPQDSIGAVFDSQNPPEKFKIEESDVCIIFVPGDIFSDLLPTLLSTQTPMVIGSTGFHWKPRELQRLRDEKKRWVHGHNFSLAMNVVRHTLGLMGRSRELLDGMGLHIHEIHHLHKRDAPSGTALKWKEWLGHPEVDISSERTGDAIGLHRLTIKGPLETLELTHESLDRKIFARGAIWAARKILETPDLPLGLIPFEDLVDHFMERSPSETSNATKENQKKNQKESKRKST